MIDVHCHLLPGIDDGATDLDMALAMARLAVDAGIQGVVCTAHHLNGVHHNPAADLRAALASLRAALAAAHLPLTLYPGAELHLVPELPDQLRAGHAMTFNDLGRAALVELPKTTVPLGAETLLEELLYQGITPIIAHPERNLTLLRDSARLVEWIGWGCHAQVTAQSITGDFGAARQQACQQWLAQGCIHLVASDAHRPRGRSPEHLAPARAMLADWHGEAVAHLLTDQNPRRLLQGEPLLAPPVPPQAAARAAAARRWSWRWPWPRR